MFCLSTFEGIELSLTITSHLHSVYDKKSDMFLTFNFSLPFCHYLHMFSRKY